MTVGAGNEQEIPSSRPRMEPHKITSPMLSFLLEQAVVHLNNGYKFKNLSLFTVSLNLLNVCYVDTIRDGSSSTDGDGDGDLPDAWSIFRIWSQQAEASSFTPEILEKN
jgi:hypothetical protein